MDSFGNPILIGRQQGNDNWEEPRNLAILKRGWIQISFGKI